MEPSIERESDAADRASWLHYGVRSDGFNGLQ